jgi:subtilisin family serine protease
MKKTLLFAAAAVLLFSCSKEEQSVQQSPNHSCVDGQYIVTFKDNASLRMNASMPYERKQEVVSTHASRMFAEAGIKDFSIQFTYAVAVKGIAVKLSASDLEKLRNNTDVLSIESDKVIALGPIEAEGGKPGGGTTPPPAQSTPWGITRVGGAVDGTGKTAWIIDTGIDFTHPDLLVDQARSKSFLTGSPSALSPKDENGHGTHVAGTIAALNNTIGVVGVAPGAKVVSVRVLGKTGSGSTSGVIAGIDYVAQNGVEGDVANMSLGGGVSSTLDNAVINAASLGVKFALAAGNETDDAVNHSPARVNGSNIYTVSAIDVNNVFAYFSNYGAAVDFAAPGVAIKSCWKGGAYNTISGTSMATPHVAGLLLAGVPLNSDGTAVNDPDGNPDLIAHR